jgi:hypothetical protein
MLKILEDAASKVIITIAIVELTEIDQKELLGALQQKMKQFGKIRWYLELEDFTTSSKQIQWQDNKFITKATVGLERIALVSNPPWHGWLTDLMHPFTQATIRHFETKDQEKAHAWLTSKEA